MTSPPKVDGAPVDAKGWPIVVFARVHVPERPSTLVEGHMVAAFGGIVEEIRKDEFWGTHIISVREFANWNVRSVLPGDCIVQRGKTKTSEADAAARSAAKRKGSGKPRRPRSPRKLTRRKASSS